MKNLTSEQKLFVIDFLRLGSLTKHNIDGENFYSESSVLDIVKKFNSLEPVEPSAPEIKEGMWWYHNDERLHRIDKIVNGMYYLGFEENGTGSCAIPYSLSEMLIGHPATPAEIESHLQKVCEKYIGKKVKDLSDRKEYSNVQDTYRGDGWTSYVPNQDQYWMDSDSVGVLVYWQGKFAEILPDKKKRPETEKEFLQFCGDFTNRKVATVQDFLKDYDF